MEKKPVGSWAHIRKSRFARLSTALFRFPKPDYLKQKENWTDLQGADSPLLTRRGGCGIKKNSRSLHNAADGVVVQENASVNLLLFIKSVVFDQPPRLRAMVACAAFLIAQPPLLTRRGKSRPVDSFILLTAL